MMVSSAPNVGVGILRDSEKEKTIMEKYDVLALLGQVGIEESSEVFRDLLRGVVRETIVGVMAREVEMLCGPSYRPASMKDCSRAGSAAGSVLFEGRREAVKRPRVRQRMADGSTAEAELVAYRAAREPGELHAMLLRALTGGVSTRDQKRVHPESPGVSKSNISRLFATEGGRIFEEFRERDIVRDGWLILMLDGVRLADEVWAIVALGVAGDGTKHMLDFEVGASQERRGGHGASLSPCGSGLCSEGALPPFVRARRRKGFENGREKTVALRSDSALPGAQGAQFEAVSLQARLGRIGPLDDALAKSPRRRIRARGTGGFAIFSRRPQRGGHGQPG
jgi:hypothetical protein